MTRPTPRMMTLRTSANMTTIWPRVRVRAGVRPVVDIVDPLN
jgi:hypothetical protein